MTQAVGDAALRRGDWVQAREEFERAVADDPDSGPAWEGLSWATWWLSDEPATFAAGERAFRAFRAAGDDVGAARSALWLASDHLNFRGEEAVAVGWLERARRLLEGVPACSEHGWVKLVEADVLGNTGADPAVVEATAGEAVRLGRELGVADLEAVGLAQQGVAALAQGRVDEGLRRLDQASAIAATEEFELPLSPSWTLCNTLKGCEGVGDFARAAQWAGTMLGTDERWRGRHFTAVCRSAYGKVLTAQGDWPAADEELVAAVTEMVRARPAMSGTALTKLGELRTRQGRSGEARELFAQAGAHPGAVLGLGALALKDGDGQAAADAAERVLRRLPGGSLVDRLPALELLAQALAGLGRHDEAAMACEEAAGYARRLGTVFLRGRSRLCQAVVTGARGDHEEARRACEDAIDLFHECSAPYDEALAREVLAGALRALGRTGAAAEEEATAQIAFAELGAQRAPVASHESLTARELEVLRLVATGLSNAAVAEKLVVSPHTVHRHMANIRAKLGLSSRAAIAAYATREQLV